jgi:hypothetical protein
MTPLSHRLAQWGRWSIGNDKTARMAFILITPNHSRIA